MSLPDDYTPTIPTEGAVDLGATATGEIETARDRGGYGDRTGVCTGEATSAPPPETQIRS